MKFESFKQKVLSCIRAWEDRQIYPNEYLVNLQNRFLGLIKSKTVENKFEGKKSPKPGNETSEDSDDVDGKPLDEDEGSIIDGKPCNALI